MTVPIAHRGLGFSHPALNVTGDSTAQGASLVLDYPCRAFSLGTLLSTSTEATIVLRGSPATSAGAPMGDLLSVTASSSGDVAFTTAADYPVRQVRVDLDAISSSGSAYAWVVGAP